jgi:hypothetical protein
LLKYFTGAGVKLNHISSGYKISSNTNPEVNPEYQELGQLVANLASANGAEIYPTLEKFGIGYILVKPVDRNLQLALDSTRELESIGITDYGQLWKVENIPAGIQATPIDFGLVKTWTTRRTCLVRLVCNSCKNKEKTQN